MRRAGDDDGLRRQLGQQGFPQLVTFAGEGAARGQRPQQLEDQASDNRIKRDITREAAKASGLSEAVNGEPSQQGLQGQLPTVE